MAKLGYARVSSTDQDLSIQRAKLLAAGAERIFEEKRSGTTLNGREAFDELMRFAREGDEILVTRIDRCARSMADFQKVTSEWKERGIRFRATDQPGVALDGTPTADLFMNVLMAFSEFETRLRRERQMEGIAKAKKMGVYKGRPSTISPETIQKLKRDGLGATEIAKRLNIGRASVYRLLQQERVR